MDAETLEKLKAIVRAVLEMSDSADVENSRQVGTRRWDSLAQVMMIAAIESEFDIIIDPADYNRLTSFKSIRLLLDEKRL